MAPIAGETKVWQYITLMKRIYLIDCPGVVYPQGDSESEIVLKGVVRVEQVPEPEQHVPLVLSRVKKEHLAAAYSVPDWTHCDDFLTKMAQRSGKLLKGGEPDLGTVAKMVLNDFQRGKLPFFTPPPGYKAPSKEDHTHQTPSDNIVDAEGPDKEEEEKEEEEETPDSDLDAELTDVGSTCSGLSDLDELDDLDLQVEEDAAAAKTRKSGGRSTAGTLPAEKAQTRRLKRQRKKEAKGRAAKDTDGPLKSDAGGKPGWAWRMEKKRRGKKPKHQ